MTWIREKIGFGFIRFGAGLTALGALIVGGKERLVAMHDALELALEYYIDEQDELWREHIEARMPFLAGGIDADL